MCNRWGRCYSHACGKTDIKWCITRWHCCYITLQSTGSNWESSTWLHYCKYIVHITTKITVTAEKLQFVQMMFQSVCLFVVALAVARSDILTPSRCQFHYKCLQCMVSRWEYSQNHFCTSKSYHFTSTHSCHSVRQCLMWLYCCNRLNCWEFVCCIVIHAWKWSLLMDFKAVRRKLWSSL